MKVPNESSPNRYDEWFASERGTEIDYDMESDVDECEHDSYRDLDEM